MFSSGSPCQELCWGKAGCRLGRTCASFSSLIGMPIVLVMAIWDSYLVFWVLKRPCRSQESGYGAKMLLVVCSDANLENIALAFTLAPIKQPGSNFTFRSHQTHITLIKLD